MEKLKGKPWSSWTLPNLATEQDLQKFRDACMPPKEYRIDHQSTTIPSKYVSLFGTHPQDDHLSISKCAACGWVMKVQHANKHFLRDSRGVIVCKSSNLAFVGDRVLGNACHPVGELTDTYSRKITLRVPSNKSLALGETSSSQSDLGSSTSNKTDNYSSQYRSKKHSKVNMPSAEKMQERRSGSGAASSHGSMRKTLSSSVTKSKSGKSQSPSQSSLRSPPSPSKVSASHKPSQSTTSGSHTCSIPSEDRGQNESVEDRLVPIKSSNHGSSKQTDHITATRKSVNKSKPAAPDDDNIKLYPDVSKKRRNVDSRSRKSDDNHKIASNMLHLFDITKQTHTSSSSNSGNSSSHASSSESSKKRKSSPLPLSKKDSAGSKKRHLQSTSSSTLTTATKPLNMTSSGQSRKHKLRTSSPSSVTEKDKEKEESAPHKKKKKRKRDKGDPA